MSPKVGFPKPLTVRLGPESCIFLSELRRPEPTLRTDRVFSSVCYPKAQFRGAVFDVVGKIIAGRHKVMFRFCAARVPTGDSDHEAISG